jgi:polyisoprenoid-binding protein YceI
MSATHVVEQIVPAGAWNADPIHSEVAFSIRHLKITTIRGSFPIFAATLTGGATPTLEGTIDVASVTTRDENRDAHLTAPDFFDAERHPQARFKATLVEPTRVVGELTLKGVTRQIELEATFTGPETDPWGNERVGVELTGEIDRTEFGVSWNTALPGGGFLLDDTVALRATFSFVKGA